MLHQLLKLVIGVSLGVLVALLLAFNALLLWVATGPRSLETFRPFLEAAFEPPDHSYSVLIDETWLIWDGWQHPLDIRLKHVTVLNKGKKFSAFPEISLGVDVLSLLRGEILPTSLTVNHPVISMFQNDDHSISFGFDNKTAEAPPESAPVENLSVPFMVALASFISPDPNSPLRQLHLITIMDASMSVGNLHKGAFFTASEMNMLFKRDRHGDVQVTSSAQIAYDKYQSHINADLLMEHGGNTIIGSVNFNQLMPGTLARLFADNPLLNAFKFPLSGKASVAFDTAGALQRLNFEVDGGKGSIVTDKLDGPLPITALHAEGQLSNNASDIEIKTLTADFGGMLFTAAGSANIKDKDAAIRGDVSLKNVSAANIHLLWPPGLSPQSREWVTANITAGNVPLADAHVNIAFGDLAKLNLPKEAVSGSITLDNAKIRYLPDHPEVSNVKGVVHVDAVSLEADIASGDYMKDTKLTGGKLVIDDLNADNPYIKVNFTAETSAKDMVHVLALPRLRHAAKLGLDAEKASGTIKGSAMLGFNFFAPKDSKGTEADVDYDISGDLTNVTQPGFMGKFDIENANGSMTVKNAGLEFKGKAVVNGVSVADSDVTYLFKPENGFDTFIDVAASAPVESLPRFGYPAFPFLHGVLGIKAKVKQGEGKELSQAVFDLTQASLTLDALKWTKPDKEPATLEMTAEKKDSAVTLPAIHLKGRDMEAVGMGQLNKDLSDIQALTLTKLAYGKTDIDSLIYQAIPGGGKFDIHGKSADVAAWVDNPGDTSENRFSFEHFPALLLKADIAHMTLGKDRELSNIKADVNCDVKMCNSANVSGLTVDNKPFAFRILRNPKGQRQVSLHAESAGAFLKAVNVFDGMEGGDLTLTGNYDDSHANSVLKGRADINEHTVKNAPILAKILSLASLTGFFDTLSGDGIHFDRLTMPFMLTQDVITIEDGKTHGDAMGMTIEGTITFPKRALDLQGTIIPSYTLNNVLGKVPLVGHMLTGGEGGGVFAARYSVKGQSDKPDVSVNPLSILTPGFLRGVFDIMDSPAKKSADAD